MPDTRFTAAEEGASRRLAAILAADVVGYSRMMAADEAGTLKALKRHRETLFDPAVAAHNGRIVKLIGDGTLAEFASVVDAVRCALAIQSAAHAGGGDAGPNIVLRIGVNLGDVIIDGDDIYGDGVNVAARLEPLAEPGGVCIAGIVAESIGNRVEAAFRDAGDVAVKNIDRPIRIWKWHPGTERRPAGATEGAGPPPPRARPSVAVLPFANMSGHPDQEYFSDGISEDIITDLSKIGGLIVIARNSSFAYKGKHVDIRAVGRELGVSSVLEGSIRRAGDRVRITAQLIDAADGAHIWAERYDRDLNDIFAVQDEVTRQIVAALKVALTPQEEKRLTAGLGGRGTASAEAFDLLLRAREQMIGPTKNATMFRDVQDVLERAIALDPDYSDAYAALGMLYNFDFQNRWSDDPDGSRARALKYSEIAAAKEPDSPFAHLALAIASSFVRDLDRAGREAGEALRLSPNYAMALNARGTIEIFRGNPGKALPDIELARRLDPSFSHQYVHFLGVAHFALGHYETAVAHFRERIALAPETDLSRGYLIAALGHLGRPEEAARVWAELKAINPRYSFAAHIGRLPFRRAEDIARLEEGFARAGIGP